MEEAAERIHSKTSFLQLTQEKQQMELSHKRARIELEKEAHNSSRDLQVNTTSTCYGVSPHPSDLSLLWCWSKFLFWSQRQVDLNQDLLTKIRRLEEKEEKTLQALNEQLDNNKSLKRNMEELQKQAHEQDGKLSEANQVQEIDWVLYPSSLLFS